MSDFAHRRMLILSAFAGAMLDGCRKGSSLSEEKKMIPTELTAEEFKLLEEPEVRAAKSGTGTLVIRAKLLGEPHRLDKVELKDIEFVDCDFLGQFMFNVSLSNVSFIRCAIAGVRWEDGKWNNVTFSECVVQGLSNNIVPGGGSAQNTFTACKFLGDAVKPGGSPDDSQLHGGFGSAGKANYENCTFERMNIRILGSAAFKNCHFSSVDMESPRSRVSIDEISFLDCTSRYTMDLSTKGIQSLSAVNVKFEDLLVNHCRLKNVRLENSRGNMSFLATDIDNFTAKKSVFISTSNEKTGEYAGGIDTRLSRIGNLSVIDCAFEGKDVAWLSTGDATVVDAHGRPVPRLSGNGEPMVYMNEWGNVALTNTAVIHADWNYSTIKRLSIEGSMFADNSLAHCEIGELTLKSVTLAGRLDFSGTRVVKAQAESLTKKDLNVVKDKTTKFDLTDAAGGSDRT